MAEYACCSSVVFERPHERTCTFPVCCTLLAALVTMMSSQVYEALRSSPKWNNTLLLITYDEHGGFFVRPLSTPLCVLVWMLRPCVTTPLLGCC